MTLGMRCGEKEEEDEEDKEKKKKRWTEDLDLHRELGRQTVELGS